MRFGALLVLCALAVAGCSQPLPNPAPAGKAGSSAAATPASAGTEAYGGGGMPETLPRAGSGTAAGSSPQANPPAASGPTAAVSVATPAATAAGQGTAPAAPNPTQASGAAAAPASAAPAPAQKPTPVPGALYQADFTDPNSGWPNNLKFDNYYIGYHEPDNYHVEVHNPNDSAIAVVPGRTFDNFSAEGQVFVAVGATDPKGDFRYGLVFRRSGSRYYAFAISPRAKTWYILKSGANGRQVLRQGREDGMQGLQAMDTLRVNANGPTLTFFINGKPITQLTDPDNTAGELGFYVETIDAAKAHIHYHSFVVRPPGEPLQNVQAAPATQCTVVSQGLNLRRGPSTFYDPPLANLATGTQLDTFGRSPDQYWLRVRVQGSGQEGWVSSLDAFVKCDAPIASLPVLNPDGQPAP